ncbi:MAG TPA: cation diffusion facilitator family transporter, partial [Herpetosiphonaceae bacterium]|nr:cation diffusion facilitator family transporter [Herpetosiphonaceae bacterium]
LADAGHMVTDAAALALSLFAVWLARRPATPERSFGFYRAEVLAALVNAASLLVISFYIFWEAFERLGAPPEVDSGPMLAVAVVGLLANAASAWVLMRGGEHEHNLNTRGAWLHVVGDMLGSVGAILAAVIMLLTGWFFVDPLLSTCIGLLILRGSWKLLVETVNILLEATPSHIDAVELRAAVRAVEGVQDIHDVHIRTVTSGLIAMSGHLEVSGTRDWDEILMEVATLLRERFGIVHATLQPEEPHCSFDSFRGCSLDSAEGRHACRVLKAGRVERQHHHAH